MTSSCCSNKVCVIRPLRYHVLFCMLAPGAPQAGAAALPVGLAPVVVPPPVVAPVVGAGHAVAVGGGEDEGAGRRCQMYMCTLSFVSLLLAGPVNDPVNEPSA